MIPENAKTRYKMAYSYARTGINEGWGGDYPHHKQTMNDLFGIRVADLALRSIYNREHKKDPLLTRRPYRIEKLPF
jgi:hypothetical protein